MPPPVRIRRDVGNLAANDPILVYFNMAIREMQSRPLRDPTSWRYQSAIHGYPDIVGDASTNPDPRLSPNQNPDGPDPFAKKTDYPLPADRDTYWRQCSHQGWFFLSWHRMYLHFFEKIVMNIVATVLHGPSDWALPYWNYSTSATAALLPAPFQKETLPQALPIPLPNGKPDTHNYLWVAERIAQANQGQPFLDSDANSGDTSLNCLKAKPFGSLNSITGAFGGLKRLSHSPNNGIPFGSLEQTPHNQVHSQLGGSGGFMGLFSTAPLDPIFWLHHCNIDRLWEVWVQRQKMLGNLDRNPDAKKGDPTSQSQASDWLTHAFDFHDATGSPVRMTSQEVLNTRAAPLSYEYEDTSDPFNNAP